VKLMNRHLREQHEEMLRRVEEAAPQPVTVKRHPEDKEPLVLDSGVVVMGGHYYTADGVVINPGDIGKDGAWEEVG
jgi:hypothetical protein